MDPKGDSGGLHVDRIDLIIQFCLAVASEGDPGERALGPIHLIKFVYLADLFHAERQQGATYTGTPWRFYHYGPWSEQVWQRVEPAAYAIDATSQIFSSPKYENDAIRYKASKDTQADDFESKLPFLLTVHLRNMVKRYRSYTSDLLHYVYATKPMLNAAPGEQLDFSVAVPEAPASAPAAESGLTDSQRRRLATVRKQLKTLRSQPRLAHRVPPETPPKYDEGFFEVARLLEDQEGHVEASRGALTFLPEVWKSLARKEVGNS